MTPDLLDDERPAKMNDHSSPVNKSAFSFARNDFSQLAITLVLLFLICLGFALRLHALERQSMWSDEGLSYYRALQSPVEILNGLIVIDEIETHDTNPPLYFLLLHYWRNLVGNSTLTLRYSGVLAGTLAVPLMYILGAVSYGRRAGLAAALLMAISPFHIWQSQVLRNYSLLLTLNLISVYGLFRYVLADREQTKVHWLALWFVAGLAGIYTHYFGFFVFAFGALALTITILRRWDMRQIIKSKRFWFIMGLGLMILLPALAIGLDRFRAGQQYDFHHIPFAQFLVHAVGAFGIGVEPSLLHEWWRMVPALILVLAGILLGWRSRLQSTLILLGYQLVPLGLMLLLSTVNPLYNGVRHLLIGLPPFLLFAAQGATGMLGSDARLSSSSIWRAILRWLLLLTFIVVIIIQAAWLYRQFTDPELLRDDIRGAAEYLNMVAEADDLIILHDTIIGFTFDYYYEGAASWQAIPSFGRTDVDSAQAALAEAGAQGKRIWFLARPTPRTGFPRKELWEWADSRWPRFFSHEFPSMWLRVQLVGYIPDPVIDRLPAAAAGVEEAFGDAIQLHGVDMPPLAKAGEPWWITFFWSKLDPDAGDYTMSLRFVDEEGQLWGQDDELIWHEFPPNKWPSDTIIGNEQEIMLASGMPPGKYDVWLRVLDEERRPLPTTGEQPDLLLGKIEIQAGTELSKMSPFSIQREKFGDVEFLGYRLPDDEIKPGHGIPIDLFWRVLQTPAEDYQLRIQLIDPTGEVIGEADSAPSRIDYPPSDWQSGELLRSQILMHMPASVDIAPHSLRVMLISPGTGETVATVTLKEKLTADPWPYTADLPAALDLLNAEFGEPSVIALQGFELDSSTILAGDLLNLTLFWQAATNVSEEYHVFVHLIDENQSIVAQKDGAPVNGFRPTLSWREGEVISDEYQIPVGFNVAPGTYQLWVGLYQPETQERPLTRVGGQPMPDRRVHIGQIRVGQAE